MPNRICDMFVIARTYRPPYYVTVDTKTTPSGNIIMTTILCIGNLFRDNAIYGLKSDNRVEKWSLLCRGKKKL